MSRFLRTPLIWMMALSLFGSLETSVAEPGPDAPQKMPVDTVDHGRSAFSALFTSRFPIYWGEVITVDVNGTLSANNYRHKDRECGFLGMFCDYVQKEDNAPQSQKSLPLMLQLDNDPASDSHISPPGWQRSATNAASPFSTSDEFARATDQGGAPTSKTTVSVDQSAATIDNASLGTQQGPEPGDAQLPDFDGREFIRPYFLLAKPADKMANGTVVVHDDCDPKERGYCSRGQFSATVEPIFDVRKRLHGMCQYLRRNASGDPRVLANENFITPLIQKSDPALDTAVDMVLAYAQRMPDSNESKRVILDRLVALQPKNPGPRSALVQYHISNGNLGVASANSKQLLSDTLAKYEACRTSLSAGTPLDTSCVDAFKKRADALHQSATIDSEQHVELDQAKLSSAMRAEEQALDILTKVSLVPGEWRDSTLQTQMAHSSVNLARFYTRVRTHKYLEMADAQLLAAQRLYPQSPRNGSLITSDTKKTYALIAADVSSPEMAELPIAVELSLRTLPPLPGRIQLREAGGYYLIGTERRVAVVQQDAADSTRGIQVPIRANTDWIDLQDDAANWTWLGMPDGIPLAIKSSSGRQVIEWSKTDASWNAVLKTNGAVAYDAQSKAIVSLTSGDGGTVQLQTWTIDAQADHRSWVSHPGPKGTAALPSSVFAISARGLSEGTAHVSWLGTDGKVYMAQAPLTGSTGAPAAAIGSVNVCGDAALQPSGPLRVSLSSDGSAAAVINSSGAWIYPWQCAGGRRFVAGVALADPALEAVGGVLSWLAWDKSLTNSTHALLIDPSSATAGKDISATVVNLVTAPFTPASTVIHAEKGTGKLTVELVETDRPAPAQWLLASLASAPNLGMPVVTTPSKSLYLPMSRVLANGPTIGFYEAALMRWTIASTRGGPSITSAASNADTVRLRLLETDNDIFIVGESTAGLLTEVDHFAISNSGVNHIGPVTIPNGLTLTLGSLDGESLSQRRARWWAVGKAGADDVAWNVDGKAAPTLVTQANQQLLGVLSVGSADAVFRLGTDGAITAQLAQPHAPNATSMWTVAGCTTPVLWSRDSATAAMMGVEGCQGSVGMLTVSTDGDGVKTSPCNACDGLLGEGPHDVSPDLSFVAVSHPSCTAVLSVSDEGKQWATSTGAVMALHASGADAGSDANPIHLWVSPSTSVLDATQRPLLHPGSCTDYVAPVPIAPSDDLMTCPLTP